MQGPPYHHPTVRVQSQTSEEHVIVTASRMTWSYSHVNMQYFRLSLWRARWENLNYSLSTDIRGGCCTMTTLTNRVVDHYSWIPHPAHLNQSLHRTGHLGKNRGQYRREVHCEKAPHLHSSVLNRHSAPQLLSQNRQKLYLNLMRGSYALRIFYCFQSLRPNVRVYVHWCAK